MDDGYRTQSPDTDREVERRQFEIWRGMTPSQKLLLVEQMTLETEGLARAGIHRRNPGATARDVFLRLASFRLDRETMVRLYGWDPEVRRG